ncbi:SH2 domain-containing protein 1B2 [Lepisosteus oculatus]|uniref:SH2 domain-containing protein 1B2 n=1 Tax=Lepisosteus oculatus TaxID=7918 RepID=UPI0037123BC3
MMMPQFDLQRCSAAGMQVYGAMDCPVYHGSISRQTCEELLSKKGKDGAFLIRDSETISGALCLCVFKKKVVYTYRILTNHAGYYTLQASPGVEEKFFKTLQDLIKNYKRSGQGLAARLQHPLKRKQQQPIYKNVLYDTPDYEDIPDKDYVDVLPS